jgi:hypothetical protein
MFCLCLRQSGLWILDVALPVGSALKDDGRVGKRVFEGKPRKVDCRGGDVRHHLLAMTLERGMAFLYGKFRKVDCRGGVSASQ